MAAKDDAAKMVTYALSVMMMPAPAGHMTKTINGQTRIVSASEAWTHPSVDQTDTGTVKTFLSAASEEYRKRGDTARANALLQQATLF